ncbi:myosin-2 essential light chain-like [Exaiptasia diaphana]|uniref:EF-hand domain-containing protein n=1 Tax=Exaiptasia diaphana TaxID=2652724 RepID=A0A913YC10_EXADI|nr:myosin-2 essential light chain-like [Exaiptasia diaphana]
MAKPLTDKEVRDLRECFYLYDKVGDDKVESSQLGEVLRGLGQNPTNAEVKKNIAEIDPEGTRRISFEEFLPIYQSFRGKKPKFSTDDFVDSLKVFDIDGSGMISEGELRHLLTSLGEKLTDEEVDTLVHGLEDKQGQIDCEQFISNVVSG